MSNLGQLLQRNKEFAARQSGAGTLMPSLPRAMPNVKALIIGCADMRVDPAHVLGIKPGEAVVPTSAHPRNRMGHTPCQLSWQKVPSRGRGSHGCRVGYCASAFARRPSIKNMAKSVASG